MRGHMGTPTCWQRREPSAYRWALEDHGVDSSRIWFSRVYVPDWRKLERVFKTFNDIIDGEGPISDEARGKSSAGCPPKPSLSATINRILAREDNGNRKSLLS